MVVLWVFAALAAAVTGPAAALSSAAVEARSRAVTDAMVGLPLWFEPNRGQLRAGVDFVARSTGFRLLLDARGVTLVLGGAEAGTEPATLRLTFPGASASPPVGIDALDATSHYFRGDRVVADVPHYGRVTQIGLYPGVDIVYYGRDGAVEFDLVFAPGADPSGMRMRFDGAASTAIDDKGDLIMRTVGGQFRQQRPLVYQWVDGERRVVESRYRMADDGDILVEVAAYDPRTTLVVDPILSYSTFLGGRRGFDAGTAVAVDAQGNAYVAGVTQAPDFPLRGAYDARVGNGDQDIFVAKLNPAGTALIYATYLGGSKGREYASGIAVDAQGNAYVTGTTDSNDFPTSANAYQKAPATGGGAFIAKLGATGSTLVYSTYLQGASNTRVAVDAAGNAFVAGQAIPSFATTAAAFQRVARSTSGNPFALSLNAAGSGVRYATFVGGSGTDSAKAMAIDGAGNLYLAGSTDSVDFPVRDALQPARKGALDGFVAKLDAAGAVLVYSTYFGGGLDDSINAIAVDPEGSVFVAGETYSWDFPIRNAAQAVKAGSHLVNSSQGNAFAAKLAPSGRSVRYSTFIGGEICYPYFCQSVFQVPQIPGDAAYGIAVDAAGNAWVTGIARSYTFPRVISRLPAKQSDDQSSLFIAKLSQGGNTHLFSSLHYTGYDGGTNPLTGMPSAAGAAIALDGAGGAYFTKGATSDFPTTAGAFQTSTDGSDATVFKLNTSPIGVTLSIDGDASVAYRPVTLIAKVAGASPSTQVMFYDGPDPLGGATIVNGVATLSTVLTPGIRTLSAVMREAGADGDSRPVVQVVNPPADCE